MKQKEKKSGCYRYGSRNEINIFDITDYFILFYKKEGIPLSLEKLQVLLFLYKFACLSFGLSIDFIDEIEIKEGMPYFWEIAKKYKSDKNDVVEHQCYLKHPTRKNELISILSSFLADKDGNELASITKKALRVSRKKERGSPGLVFKNLRGAEKNKKEAIEKLLAFLKM